MCEVASDKNRRPIISRDSGRFSKTLHTYHEKTKGKKPFGSFGLYQKNFIITRQKGAGPLFYVLLYRQKNQKRPADRGNEKLRFSKFRFTHKKCRRILQDERLKGRATVKRHVNQPNQRWRFCSSAQSTCKNERQKAFWFFWALPKERPYTRVCEQLSCEQQHRNHPPIIFLCIECHRFCTKR